MPAQREQGIAVNKCQCKPGGVCGMVNQSGARGPDTFQKKDSGQTLVAYYNVSNLQ